MKSKRKMALKYELLITALYGLLKLTTQSIIGLTYMDDYDFEEKYTNINECNPFYWHPLHMPEHCNKVFEKLIRGRVGALGAARIVKEKKSPYYHFDERDLKDDTLAPYEKMVELLKKDVQKEPAEPEITFLPGLGAAALYNQPVSKLSGDYMKAVAKAYKDISFAFGPLYNPVEYNTTETENDQKKALEEMIDKIKLKGESLRQGEYKKKPKYNVRKKINKGGLLTVFRTKHN